jgi:hypothetical protein
MPGNGSVKVISAELDSELVERFCNQVDARGFKKKRALAGAVELWLSLPPSLQAYVLSDECGEDVFAEMMNYILNNQIDQIRERIGDRLAGSRVHLQKAEAASAA